MTLRVSGVTATCNGIDPSIQSTITQIETQTRKIGSNNGIQFL